MGEAKYDVLLGKTISQTVKDLMNVSPNRLKEIFADVAKKDPVVLAKLGVEFFTSIKKTIDKDYAKCIKVCESAIDCLNKNLNDNKLTEDERKENLKAINTALEVMGKAYEEKQKTFRTLIKAATNTITTIGVVTVATMVLALKKR